MNKINDRVLVIDTIQQELKYTLKNNIELNKIDKKFVIKFILHILTAVGFKHRNNHHNLDSKLIYGIHGIILCKNSNVFLYGGQHVHVANTYQKMHLKDLIDLK